VASQVVHADKGQPGSCGDPLGAHDAGQHTTDQAWTCRDGNRIDVRKGQAGLVQGLPHNQIDPFRVGARSNLWDHTPEVGVEFGLIENHRRDNAIGNRTGSHNGRCGFIAGAFQSEKCEGGRHGSTVA
jgi:hypothetical protein